MDKDMEQNVEELMQTGAELAMTYLPKLALAVITLVIGLWLIKRVHKIMVKLMQARQSDPTLQKFLLSLFDILFKAILFISVASMVGIETTSFIAILGAAGLAVGLALQGTLGHVASGVMLLMFRPFKIGDYIEAGGHAGTVDSIGLFMTQLKTPDNIEIIIPNSAVWDGTIRNFSYNKTRRVDFLFGIGYNDSIDDAIKLIDGLVKADERIQKDPEPLIVVSNLGDS